MFAIDTYGACEPDQAWSCRITRELTGNDTAASLAELLLGKPAAVLGIILLGVLGRWVLHRIIDRLVRRAEHSMMGGRPGKPGLGLPPQGAEAAGGTPVVSHRRKQRTRTLGSLLKSVATGVIIAVVGIMALSEIGVNVAPLIASAGIVGVALGFGAQSLVSDVISGVFMLVEDQYGVGDEVDLGEAIGTVEAVSLRVTRVRDIHGTVWYVRNGEIVRVGNQSQNWSKSVLDISVGYGEDLERVNRILREASHDMWEDEDYRGQILEEPTVLGIQDLGVDGVTVRLSIKTAPGEQWAVSREMRLRIKNRFDAEGIEIPLPQRVVWSRDPRHGEAAGAGAPGGATGAGA
ncbi:mechanosensitive ion channel family protein [Nocardioides lentus]|uniref:Mechanosensitive ion channel family protein n=1 Tax=Nocardioides lentus TaxID=338077 RepID=A0ABN2PEL4_9ACTN